MNAFPSAFAPCRAKKSEPGSTFRESQATFRISSLFAFAGRAVSTSWNTSLNFLPLSVEPPRAECFRWRSTWFVVASCTCSSWLNPIFILMPDSPMRLLNFWCRCSELHGYLRARPDLCPRRRRLICCKPAANQNRLQPQPQARFRHFAHRLSGEIRHWNVAALIHGHGHRRRRASALTGIGCHELGRRLVGLLRKIRGREILEYRTIRYVAIPVRRLEKPRTNGHIARHIQIWQYLLGDSLENRRGNLAALVLPHGRIQRH